MKLSSPHGLPTTVVEAMYPTRSLRRSWTNGELLDLLGPEAADVLDIGAGRNPVRVRAHDRLTTVDFEPGLDIGINVDVTQNWPFADASFDVVYMSHVIEHFHPRDRDVLINNVYHALREGGLAVIRVPHVSSRQATGWEHFSMYGLNAALGLCHGRNPNLPMFRNYSTGVSLSLQFDAPRSRLRQVGERVLNASWELTDRWLGFLIGGIPEVQFVLQKMPESVENALRESDV